MKLNNCTRWVWLFLLMIATNVQAQSLGDLFNKETLGKVVNAVTGANNNVQLEGTWTYKGSAIEFVSDNLLMKAGGAAAASAAENKLDEQLSKVGIKPGQLSFTFAADSTMSTTVAGKTMKGKYSYNAESKQVKLQFARLLNIDAKLNYTTSNIDLLFNSDKLLKLIVFLSKQTSNSTLQAISSVADSYDGMMVGLELEKQ